MQRRRHRGGCFGASRRRASCQSVRGWLTRAGGGWCDAYDRWAKSRSTGGNVGFPRFKRRGRDADRYRITTGALRLDGRHHVAIPRIGRVRTCENTRKLARHLEKGPDRAKIRGATIRRRGTRIEIVLEVDIVRPQSRDQVADPDSTVGVDVGVRRLATVANDRGEVVAVHENPRALDRVLADIKAVSRRRSRCEKGSGRYNKHTATLSGLHARAANIRAQHLHQMTTCLAKSHGTIVVEGARWPALIAQRGLPGARTRRRNLHDASPGEIRRQLAYKTRWYGSELVVADGFYPSSKTCPGCGHVQDIGWATEWACAQCGKVHDRDEAAAVNLAVYPQQDLGTARCDCGCRRSPVGASVKRRPKAKPEPAADTAVGTGDEPKTATAFDAEGFTGSGDATGRVRRQGHAKRGAPEQRGTPETPRRGARTLVSTNT